MTISNCVFDGTDRGIRIKSTRGRGGVVEDIRVSNVVMSDIKREAVVLNLKYSQMKMEKKNELMRIEYFILSEIRYRARQSCWQSAC